MQPLHQTAADTVWLLEVPALGSLAQLKQCQRFMGKGLWCEGAWQL